MKNEPLQHQKVRKNRSGFRGVSVRRDNKTNPYGAFISPHGKLIYLGGFPTPEEAANAYDVAARKYYGENALTNSTNGKPIPVPKPKTAEPQAEGPFYLTPTEREIFNLLIAGESMKSAAKKLKIGRYTVPMLITDAEKRNGLTRDQIIWTMAEEFFLTQNAETALPC